MLDIVMPSKIRTESSVLVGLILLDFGEILVLKTLNLQGVSVVEV